MISAVKYRKLNIKGWLYIALLSFAICLGGQDASGSATKSVYDRAMFAYESENFQQALNYVNACLAKSPDDPDYLLLRAKIYIDLNNLQSALSDCERALKANPGNASILRRRGYCYLVLKQYQRGLKDLTYCTVHGESFDFDSVFPLNDFANIAKAQALLRQDKAARQSAVYDSHCKILERALDLRESSQITQALKEVDRVIKQDPGFWMAYGVRGLLYLNLAKNDRAIADFSIVLKRYPDSLPLLYLRADAYREKEDYQSALADYTRILKRPAKIVIFRYVANTGRSRENFKYRDYDIVNRADILFLRGTCYLAQTKYALAEADFARVIKLDAGEWEAYFHIGKIQYSQKDYQKAILSFSKVLKIKPASHDALIERARAYEKAKNYALSERDFSSLVQSNPKDPGAITMRGQFYERTGQFGKAIADYSKVIALWPRDDDGYRYRADLYFKMKDYAKALTDYRKAIALGSEDKKTILKSIAEAQKLFGSSKKR